MRDSGTSVERLVDRSRVDLERAVQNRDVNALDVVARKLFAEMRRRGGRARENEEPRRLLVQAVHRKQTVSSEVASIDFSLQAMQQTGLVPVRWHRQKTRVFVDDDKRRIEVNNAKSVAQRIPSSFAWRIISLRSVSLMLRTMASSSSRCCGVIDCSISLALVNMSSA